MAYIGKQPVIGNFQKCDSIAVVNGQAAYTLQVGGTNVSPQSENHMLVSLNGILQAPVDSFTVSGSTLTFASNLITGDVIDFVMILGNVLDLGVPSDNTVSTAKIVDANVTSAKMFSGFANGITEADQWRLTADLTGTNATISSNLERIDTAGQGTLGTGMTESSGIFTFPSTGIWLVQFDGNAQNDAATDNMSIIIKATINNSSYTAIAHGSTSSGGTAQNQAGTLFAQSLVDVTNTTNVKVLFETSSFAAASFLGGNTTQNYTTFTFIRLGDT